jgi:hypothetical protein
MRFSGPGMPSPSGGRGAIFSAFSATDRIAQRIYLYTLAVVHF